MSDTIDDAAWPPQLNIRRWLGNVAGFARQREIWQRGRRAPIRTRVKAGTHV